MSIQLTAYSIADLWKEGMRDFSLYEVTKTNKVVKHPIRDLITFDDCIIIAIGNDTVYPKHRLVYSQGSGSKRILGDSIYYTDFLAVKSKFNAKNGVDELKTEIEKLNEDIKLLSDTYISKTQKYERLLEGIDADYIKEMEIEDKEHKDKIAAHLKKSIYHFAPRYGSDLSFTFLIDRIFSHDKTRSQEELVELYKDTSNEELEKVLTSCLK